MRSLWRVSLAAGGNLCGGQRSGIQDSVLKNLDRTIVGQNGNLGAAILVPDKITQRQAHNLEGDSYSFGLRLGR